MKIETVAKALVVIGGVAGLASAGVTVANYALKKPLGEYYDQQATNRYLAAHPDYVPKLPENSQQA